MQEDLDRADEWTLRWGLKFSPRKCQVVLFAKLSAFHEPTLTEDNVRLPNTKSIRFLGLTFAKHLIWKAQVKRLERETVYAANLLKYLPGF